METAPAPKLHAAQKELLGLLGCHCSEGDLQVEDGAAGTGVGLYPLIWRRPLSGLYLSLQQLQLLVRSPTALHAMVIWISRDRSAPLAYHAMQLQTGVKDIILARYHGRLATNSTALPSWLWRATPPACSTSLAGLPWSAGIQTPITLGMWQLLWRLTRCACGVLVMANTESSRWSR